MSKLELKLEFDQYLSDLKIQAFKLIDENNYDNIAEVMKDCINKTIETKRLNNVKSIYGYVHRESAGFEIEEDQFLPIFSEIVEEEDEN